MDSEHYIDGDHNGGVFNHFNHNSYGYCYQNPVRLIDPNGKQVDIVVESGYFITGNVGHTFVMIGRETTNPTVYTYGRYGSLENNKGSLNFSNIRGEGVLIKLEGNDAINFTKKYVQENGASIFNI